MANGIGGQAFRVREECPPKAFKSTASIVLARDRMGDQISGCMYQGIDEQSRQGGGGKEGQLGY